MSSFVYTVLRPYNFEEWLALTYGGNMADWSILNV